jgi:pantoate--beta-alanine ligase
MDIIESVQEMSRLTRELRRAGQTIGFVPTMGFLHEGHLSLVREAKKENDRVVVSIFVNPTQFGPGEDYEEYPRDLEGDAEKLRVIGIDYIFNPEVADMYPEGYNSFVEVSGITEVLCGKSRPGHFRGVTTVVTKLFNIIQPDRAYFGQKDFQQLMVIKKMVRELNIPVEVKGLPIIREEDGLARSSRNKYLDNRERAAATALYHSLMRARELYQKGIKDTSRIKKEVIDLISSEPLARIDYVEIVDPDTLQEIKRVKEQALVALAVYIGKTRLIDNLLLGEV